MKRKIDLTAVIEQALGAIVAAGPIALIGFIYQRLTQQEISLWIWLGIFSFITILLIAIFWRLLREFLSLIGKFIIKYWFQFSLITLSFISFFILIRYNNLWANIVLMSALILGTYFLTEINLKRKFAFQPKTSADPERTLPQSKLGLFSRHLDDLSNPKRKYFSGTGLRFLDLIKKAPPFLDIQFQSPSISLQNEQTLSEYFRSKAFVQFVNPSVRGGKPYQVRKGDTFSSIAKTFYGDKKFSKQIVDHNPGLYTLSTGVFIELPYIDLEKLDTSHSYLEKHYKRVKGTVKFLRAIKQIADQYGLVDEEVLLLLTMIYNAAQLTMGNNNLIEY